MGELKESKQHINDEAEEAKATYERPILRRVGWLRDVTAQTSSD